MKVRRTLRAIFLVFALEPALISAETLAEQGTSTFIGICPSCKEVRVQLVPDDRSKSNLNEGPKVEVAYFNGAATRDAAEFSQVNRNGFGRK